MGVGEWDAGGDSDSVIALRQVSAVSSTVAGMTLGEKRVVTKFNPSNTSGVDVLKHNAALLIDQIECDSRTGRKQLSSADGGRIEAMTADRDGLPCSR